MNKRTTLAALLAICLLAFAPTRLTAGEPPEMADSWSSQFVYANGIRIHYYRAVPAPGKPVIVMVHGVTDIGLCWSRLAWELQDDYDIYALDTRGHGLSDPFTDHDDGDTLVKDVVAVVEALGLEKPILMGHSMGAATVMRIGAEYPDLASAVVMLDPMLGGFPGGAPGGRGGRGGAPGGGVNPPPQRIGPPTQAPQPGSDDNPAPPRIMASMNAAPEQLVAQNNQDYDALVEYCRRANPQWDIVDCKYWALSKKQYHGGYTPEQFAVMSGVMQVGDSLARITAPAIVLKADTSPEGRAANERAASVIQKGRLVHIDNAGHNVHHDQLDRVVEEITKFLDEYLGEAEE